MKGSADLPESPPLRQAPIDSACDCAAFVFGNTLVLSTGLLSAAAGV